MNTPNYNKIYNDLIERKFPERKEELSALLSKKIKTSLQLIRINNTIFDDPEKSILMFNQKLRSYDELSIKEILKYQKKHNLTNAQMSSQFKFSRNSITKWKKLFQKQ